MIFSLAAFRYRHVLAERGGPIASLDAGVLPVFGRKMFQVNACLVPGLVAKAGHRLYGDVDGTGTHRIESAARHMAISEALERWAFHATVTSDRAQEYGFDVDPSTNGMSAYPGLGDRNARRHAMLEAVERYSIIAWWEGQSAGRRFETDWPGVSAVAIDGPFGGVTVIAYARTDFGMHVYGFAAEESFGAACERAVTELARNENVLRAWWLGFISGETRQPTNRFERRCLYFSGDGGHEEFLERVGRPVPERRSAVKVVCDREITGPWCDYATIWRFALVPPSPRYLTAGDDYFFW